MIPFLPTETADIKRIAGGMVCWREVRGWWLEHRINIVFSPGCC